MTTYTIAICILNMASTAEESLNSILDQIDEEYEVLVIDDGSTDGSFDILEEFDAEYDNFRFIMGDNDNIAEARNHGFREANGQYILDSLDVDDKYDEAIQDFVEVFHQLESNMGDDLYLKGHSINMSSKKMQLAYPFRSMTYGEDPDRWRRLSAADKIVWLQHEPFYEEIEQDDAGTRRKKSRMITTAEFRSGVTFRSYVTYCMKQYDIAPALLQLSKLVIPYLTAVSRGRYELPDGYEVKAKLQEEIARNTATVAELEEELEFQFDQEQLSHRGREIFFENTDESPLAKLREKG